GKVLRFGLERLKTGVFPGTVEAGNDVTGLGNRCMRLDRPCDLALQVGPESVRLVVAGRRFELSGVGHAVPLHQPRIRENRTRDEAQQKEQSQHDDANGQGSAGTSQHLAPSALWVLKNLSPLLSRAHS